jgi:hypothetical protein
LEPFSRYPGGGQQLLGKLRGANARRQYGLRLQRLTGERACAYCGLDLTDSFEHWLLLQVDHVVPVSVAKSLGIPVDFCQDMINCVLACSACNSFDNRFSPLVDSQEAWTLSQFIALRDELFAIRRARIATLLTRERAFFNTQPWS